MQDAWLRWSAADRDDVADARAYLVRITSRLALDRLGSARARRESYVGPWLPEPLLTGAPRCLGPAAPDPETPPSSASRCPWRCWSCWRRSRPAERAVFVLREVFGMPVAEVAGALGPVRGRRPADGAPRPGARAGPAAAVRRRPAGAARGHRAVPRRRRRRRRRRRCWPRWRPASSCISDGGGKANAARRPIVGADKVARFLAGSPARAATCPGCGSRSPRSTARRRVVAWTDAGPFMAISLVAGRRPDRAGAGRRQPRQAGRARVRAGEALLGSAG